jgi:ADP-dependent phosphofructokinase/glucokinase
LKAAILPVPLAASPILVKEFVQEYVVPDTLNVEAKEIAVVFVPSQTTWLEIASTVGVGLTTTLTVFVAEHPFAVIV